MMRLCHESDVGEGCSRGFDPLGVGSDTMFLVRHQGRLHAWRNACPHIDGAPMAWRKDAYMNGRRTHVACHAHGAWFAPDTGLCVQGPCLGRSLESLAIEIDQQGQVCVHFANAHEMEHSTKDKEAVT